MALRAIVQAAKAAKAVRKALPSVTLREMAKEIIQLHETTGGSTYSLIEGNLARTKGYAVALYPERRMILNAPPKMEEVVNYMRQNVDLLGQPGHAVGTWAEELGGLGMTQHHLDISAVLPYKEQALRLGRQFGERYIFDLDKMDSIAVPRSGPTLGVSPEALRTEILTHKAPTLQKMLTDFHEGRIGAEWYNETPKALREMMGNEQDAQLMAGFLASTSQAMRNDRAVGLAMQAYNQHKAGKPFTGYLPAVKDNLARVVQGQEPVGPKINSYYRALLGDENAFVADRWMSRYFGFGDVPSEAQWDLMRRKIEAAAQKMGKPVREVQSSIWHFIRKKYGSQVTSEPLQNIMRRQTPEAGLIGGAMEETITENLPAWLRPLAR